MIIDSHAHYNHGAYQNTFRYLTREQGVFTLMEGNREDLLCKLWEAGILCTIEPGLNLLSCQEVLALSRQYPDRIFPAMGVHPTRSILEDWRHRRELAALAAEPGVVAVGETGLDYHYKREEQHRRKQFLWFLYQLDLAWKVKKPLILHIRDAHEDASRILKLHPARKLGGVVHCFYGDRETAVRYVNLGFHIGIGGAILHPQERAGALWEAVAAIPMDRILLETDAPFILPDCKDAIPGKQRRKARNTSLILPAVAEKIAELKGISPAEVEAATTANAIRLFRLPMEQEP